MSRLVSQALPPTSIALGLPCPPPPPDEDVQSLLARAGAAHARELQALRKMNRTLKTKLSETIKQAGQNLKAPSGQSHVPTSIDCTFHTTSSGKELVDDRIILTEIKECRACPDKSGESKQIVPLWSEKNGQNNQIIPVSTEMSGKSNQITFEYETHRSMCADDTWSTLSQKLLDVDDPTGLRVFASFKAWKRWMLLSYHLIRYRVEGRPPFAIRKHRIELDILKVWTTREPRHHKIIYTSKTLSLDGTLSKGTSNDLGNHRKWVIHPHSIKLFLWIFLGGIAVLYDLYMIPLDISDLASPATPVAIAISIFWAIDLLICCSTGVETQNGMIDMRFATIWRVYSRSWLVPDLCVLAIDVFLLGVDTGMYGTLRANRFGRLIRLMRLFRLRKIGDAWRNLVNSVYAAYLVLLGKVAKYIIVIFTIDHYIACMWYCLAAWQDADESTWLDTAGDAADNKVACYVYSLHWALTQFSPATQDVAPQNARERTFALCITLFALVCFSSFISQLTNALNQLLLAKHQRGRQEQSMREFFRTHNISKELGARIICFFHKRYESVQERMPEGSVDFFTEVPQSMMLNLHEEMHLDVLKGNAFFNEYYSDTTRRTFLKICHTAMCLLTAHPSQDVFIKTSTVTSVYTLTNGALQYKYTQGGEHCEVKIKEGTWLSEIGLWVKCEHVGTLTASTGIRCDLSAIILSALVSIFASGGEPLFEPFRCAAIFAVQQLELEASKGNWPTDLPLSVAFEDNIFRRARALISLRCSTGDPKPAPGGRKLPMRISFLRPVNR